MRRKLLIALFSTGIVVGFGSAIVRGWYWHHHGHGPRGFRARWADECAQAALRATDKTTAAPPAAARP